MEGDRHAGLGEAARRDGGGGLGETARAGRGDRGRVRIAAALATAAVFSSDESAAFAAFVSTSCFVLCRRRCFLRSFANHLATSGTVMPVRTASTVLILIDGKGDSVLTASHARNTEIVVAVYISDDLPVVFVVPQFIIVSGRYEVVDYKHTPLRYTTDTLRAVFPKLQSRLFKLQSRLSKLQSRLYKLQRRLSKLQSGLYRLQNRLSKL